MERVLLCLSLLAVCLGAAEPQAGGKVQPKRDYLAELKNADELVRGDAALLLKSNPKAVSALVRALENDPSDEVKQWAAFALGELQSKEAVPPLLRFLKERPEKSTRTFYVAGKKGEHQGDIVRRNVCWALGPIGDLRALEPLLKEVREAKDWEVRFYAISSLNKLGSPRAIPVLEEIAKSDPYKRDWEKTYIVRDKAKEAIAAIQAKAEAEK